MKLEQISPAWPWPHAPFNCRRFAPGSPLRPLSVRDVVPLIDAAPIIMAEHPAESNAGLVLLDGHRRMAEAAFAGTAHVNVLILPESTSAAERIRIALAGRQHTTGVEKLLTVHTVTQYLGGQSQKTNHDSNQILEQFMGRSINTRYLATLDRLASMRQDELAALHYLGLPFERLHLFSDCLDEERNAVLLLLSRFAFTSSEVKQTLRSLRMLRGRRDFKPSMLLAAIDQHDSSGSVLAAIRDMTHPTLTRREATLRDQIKAIAMPSAARLQAPEHLEGNEISCYFRFSSVQELDDYVNRLRRAIDSGQMAELLEELNG
jgi:hypothetical protein